MTDQRVATVEVSRTSDRGRRAGYVIGAAVNLVLLYLVNVWPGWQAVPFLTPDTAAVIPWVNASILVGAAADVVYLVRDTRGVKAVGDLVTTIVGLVVLVRLWQVFPFDVSGGWETVIRAALVVVTLGCAIGVVVSVVRVVGALAQLLRRAGAGAPGQ